MAWTRKAWKSQCVSVVSDLCGLCWSLCFVCFSDYCLCVYVSVFFNDCCWSVCFCLFQGFLLVSAFVCFSGLWWSLLCVFQRSLLVSLLLCVSVITVGLSVSVCFSVFPQFLFVCFCVFQWSLLVQMGGVYFSVFFYDHCWPGSFCMFQCVSVVTVALSAFVCQWSLLVCLLCVSVIIAGLSVFVGVSGLCWLSALCVSVVTVGLICVFQSVLLVVCIMCFSGYCWSALCVSVVTGGLSTACLILIHFVNKGTVEL